MGGDMERKNGAQLAPVGGDGGQMPGCEPGFGKTGLDQADQFLRRCGTGKADSGDDASRYLRHLSPRAVRNWSPIWVDRTEICFSSIAGTLRPLLLGGWKHVVNQWLAAGRGQIRMLLKMICRFKDLS